MTRPNATHDDARTERDATPDTASAFADAESFVCTFRSRGFRASIVSETEINVTVPAGMRGEVLRLVGTYTPADEFEVEYESKVGGDLLHVWW